MARLNIEQLEKIEKQRYNVHDKVETTYSVFEANGEKYLQIDTYGTAGRKIPDSISQSLQIDREAAKLIVDLLIQEFKLNYCDR
jgi:hypothetical protein